MPDGDDPAQLPGGALEGQPGLEELEGPLVSGEGVLAHLSACGQPYGDGHADDRARQRAQAGTSGLMGSTIGWA